MAVVASVVGIVARVGIALVLALLVAVPLSLVVFRDDFARSFAVACLVLGSLALLMAFGGSSPSRRMGVQDPWFASFFPKLVRPMGEQYSHTRLSDAAVFVLTGLALIVLGFALLG